MTIQVATPRVGELGAALEVLRTWQHDGAPVQLHPGDIGWYWRFGAEATAAALRIWHKDGVILALGLLDEPVLLRLAIAPQAQQDEALALQLLTDVGDPRRGVLPAGEVFVEAPESALVHDLLGGAGWALDEPWAVLRRDLTGPVADPGVRIEVIDGDRAHIWCAVHQAAFGQLTSEELMRRWAAMSTGSPYADARALVAFEDEDTDVAVAEVIVWSAGSGRYGVVEPMGTHVDHRGHGYGTAMNLAAARTLQEMGATAAVVATPSSNVGAVATYTAAGFDHLVERRDRRRDA